MRALVSENRSCRFGSWLHTVEVSRISARDARGRREKRSRTHHAVYERKHQDAFPKHPRSFAPIWVEARNGLTSACSRRRCASSEIAAISCAIICSRRSQPIGDGAADAQALGPEAFVSRSISLPQPTTPLVPHQRVSVREFTHQSEAN